MALLWDDPPMWFYVLGVLAVAGLVLLFWRARTSLSDLEGAGHPAAERRDRSARQGPRTRVREWLDPNATGHEDDRPPRRS
jgi:hypothetical protein